MALLDDLFEGEVGGELRADLDEHLRGCEHCFVTMNTTRQTIEFYTNRELYPLPDAIRERLEVAIMEKCRKC
jgi:5S rRNA maturation endonuclease (ribonuclease M5)